MATIVATLNAASPGTQADDVTTDVNLTYKVYNDVDSYVTAETFGSHVTDADVTVAAGVVTITNVIEPVGVNSYKISSVDEAGNESILSAESSVILLSDDFAGTTIDTSLWDVQNPDSPDITITQNNALIFNVITPVAPTNGSNVVLSQNEIFDVGVDTIFFYINLELNPSASSVSAFGFDNRNAGGTGASYNGIAIGTIIDGTHNLQVTEAGTATFSLLSSSFATATDIKLKITDLEVVVYTWNGSAWVEDVNHTFSGLDAITGMNVFMKNNSNVARISTVRGFHVSKHDFNNIPI